MDNLGDEKKVKELFNDKNTKTILEKVKKSLNLKNLKYSFEELEMFQYHINLKNKNLGKRLSSLLDNLNTYIPKKEFSVGKAFGLIGVLFLCLSLLFGMPILLPLTSKNQLIQFHCVVILIYSIIIMIYDLVCLSGFEDFNPLINSLINIIYCLNLLTFIVSTRKK